MDPAGLEKYRASHRHPMNRLSHAVGIPLIIASLPTVFFSWRIALGMFVGGWILQLVGHAFEGKPPAFFSDWRYLLVGARWWARKITGREPKPPENTNPPSR